MTAAHDPVTARAVLRSWSNSYDADGDEIAARGQRSAMVVAITGDIDAGNVDHVGVSATCLVTEGYSFLLDLSGVEFFAVQGVAMLVAVDKVCRGHRLPWTVVTNRAVDRVLGIVDRDRTLRRARSVSQAMEYFAQVSRMPARSHSNVAVLEHDTSCMSS